MDYSAVLSLVVDIIEVCFPISLIFGISGKIVNFALDMIFNRKISL